MCIGGKESGQATRNVFQAMAFPYFSSVAEMFLWTGHQGHIPGYKGGMGVVEQSFGMQMPSVCVCVCVCVCKCMCTQTEKGPSFGLESSRVGQRWVWRCGHQKRSEDEGRGGWRASQASRGPLASLTRAHGARRTYTMFRAQRGLTCSEQRRRGQSTYVESKVTRQESGSLHWLQFRSWLLNLDQMRPPLWAFVFVYTKIKTSGHM